MPARLAEDIESAWPLSKFDRPFEDTVAQLPLRMKGPMVWTSDDFKSDKQYVIQLSQADIVEIEKAIRSFQDLHVDLMLLTKETFPLSTELSARLQSVSIAVHYGYGFSVLRGLDPSKYTDEQNLVIFGGITSHVGRDRSSMRHIRDRTREAHEPTKVLRPPELPVDMAYHTDVNLGDVLAMYTQSQGLSGGAQGVVSFWKIYNDLLTEDPDVLRTLSEPWRFELPWSDHVEVMDRPLLQHKDGKLMLSFAKAYLTDSIYAKRLPGNVPLTTAQLHAIATIERKCKQHGMTLTQQRGDLIFINNLSMLHARQGFVDDPMSGKCRHILHLVLRDPVRAWKLPESLAVYVNKRFDGPSARAMVLREEFDDYARKFEVDQGVGMIMGHD